MRTVGVVVAPHAFRTGIAALLDLCHLANRYAATLYQDVEPTRAVEARLLSLDGAPVLAADGRPIAVDGSLDPAQVYDGVYLTAFDIEDAAAIRARLAGLASLPAWIGAQHAGGAVIAGSGPAAFVLAEAGLLARGRCAPPWRLEQAFRRRYPQVALEPGPAVVEWGRVLTTGAMNGEPALALRLLESVLSPNLADVLGKLTRVGEATHHAAEDPAFSSEAMRRDPLVGRAQYALQQNFSHEVSLEALAADLGVSQRTLLRRFRAAAGMTPLAYLQHVRIESAKQMLAKSSRPIERIGYMVGYADGGFFMELFRRATGMTPAEYRRRVREAG